MSKEVEQLKKAVFDNRVGKSLDLSEEPYEIFWMIFNDGVSHGASQYETCHLEELGDDDIVTEWNKSWGRQDIEADLDDETKQVLKDISQATIHHYEKIYGELFRRVE